MPKVNIEGRKLRKQLTVRLGVDQCKEIKAAAAQCGVGLSDFVSSKVERGMLLDAGHRTDDLLANLAAALTKIEAQAGAGHARRVEDLLAHLTASVSRIERAPKASANINTGPAIGVAVELLEVLVMVRAIAAKHDQGLPTRAKQQVREELTERMKR